MLSANRISAGSGRKWYLNGMFECSCKTRRSSLRFGSLIPPGNQPREVERQGNEHMLQRCFRQTSIAGVAQVKAVGALADRAFDPSPPLVALLELLRFLIGPCNLQRFVLRLRPQLQHARTTRCFGTRLALTTGTTLIPVKLDLDNRIPILVMSRSPAPAGLALRA